MKRFIDILTTLVSRLSDTTMEMVMEAIGLSYEDGYAKGREYEAANIPAPAPVYGLPLEHVESILLALRNGRKMQAIKELRQHSGLGLREAKDWVERYATFVKGYNSHGKWVD